MLYLKGMNLTNFKSFKHASLLFSKGFTCIVGPNGSGKSNICDALLFSLGEGSLKRMRADKLESLITSSARQKNKLAKTYVKLTFGGDEDIEVVRAARADGKSAYKLNGKRMTKQEVVEVLKRHQVSIDPSSTITQGEISRMMELNPKERRELIDIASGISEFESKKAESLRELDKVNLKAGELHAILNERLGYLKDLEKEKEAAESFMDLGNRKKLLQYNVLSAREQDIKQNYDKYSKELALLDAKKQKLAAEIGELSSAIAKLSTDRQQLTKEMSETTLSSSEEGKKLESINKDLALIAASLETNRKQQDEKSQRLMAAKEEIKEITAAIAANKEELLQHNKKIADAEPMFADSKETTESNDNRMANLHKQISSLEQEATAMQETISALQADLAATKNSVVEQKSRLENTQSQLDEKEKTKREINQGIESISKSTSKFASEITQAESRSKQIVAELGEIDTKSLALKEQRAMNASRESAVYGKVGNNFGEKDGFFGRVSQLCTYGAENAQAVEACAGARFDYFVVDSIESASKIISFLKKNDLGRATFIPMNDLTFEGEKKRDAKLSAVIDVLKFEKKFGRVFEYVFSNTYIIGSVEESKEYGVGKHRYVTLAGELVEQSGILSGGSAKRRLSLASIESQLKELESKRAVLFEENGTISNNLTKLRKQKAQQELDDAKMESQLASIDEQLVQMREEIKKVSSTIKSHTSKISELEERIREGSKERDKSVAELESLRQEADELYNKSIEAAKAIAKHGMSKEEKERIQRAREELEKLKVRVAELQTENKVNEKRKKELAFESTELAKVIDGIKADSDDKNARKIAYEKGRAELEDKIRSSSSASKRALDKMHGIEDKVASLSSEKGKKDAEKDEADRALNEINNKRGQLEVRLVDLRAELSAFPQGIEKVNMPLDEMEKELTYVGVKIEQLGAVNLKAPEVYETKKGEVGEAESRLNTLAVEKEAIMKMIEEIDSKKLKIFQETFDAVNTNFTKLYNYIFPGKAQIELENPKDPFNSGLHIKIADGKTYKREHALSGGEKSLVMLMLIFSIHMHKPSALYIFDEVDSALDKENSKKLSHLIKEMSRNSQFVVVSHNDSLIVNSDTAVGVSKTEGESRAVGLQVANIASKQQQTHGA